MTARAALVALLFACVCAPACKSELPPVGQVAVTVDTDMPVTRFASRLRVDVYSADGAWIDSRDQAMDAASRWPASFTVFDSSDRASARVLVRLRLYPDGAVRDYRGERYVPRPPDVSARVVETPAPPDAGPRLLRAAADVTPATEPIPSVTIDRLASVVTRSGAALAAFVELQGACSGVMANIAAATSCTDAEHPDAPADAELPSAPDGPSRVGTFGADVPCSATLRKGGTDAAGRPLHDEEVCVPGGSFLFGSNVPLPLDSIGSDVALASSPQRFAVVSPFVMDRDEVTVGRVRHALANGLTLPDPLAPNDGPLAAVGPASSTYTTNAGEREEHPLNFVTKENARSFCRAQGGDLPTEVQWEYAATAAGRAGKTVYAWGDDAPTCARIVFARGPIDASSAPGRGVAGCSILGSPLGPAPVTAGQQDVTPGLGLRDLGASMSEWVKDSGRDLGSACWLLAPTVDPSCDEPRPTQSVRRGAAWTLPTSLLSATQRIGVTSDALVAFFDIGLRCVRRPDKAPTP